MVQFHCECQAVRVIPVSHVCGSSCGSLWFYKFFLSDGRLPLSCGGSRKVYDLIAVNTVPSRSSRYIEVSCAKNQDLNGISGKLVLPAINSIMHIAGKV